MTTTNNIRNQFAEAAAQEGLGVTVTAGENLSILKGEGRSGDFVHQTQTMGTAEGFRNVSKKWLDQTWSYEQGFEALAADKSKTNDIMIPLREMKCVVHEGKFAVRVGDEHFNPTEHALEQMAGWSGVSKWYANYLTNAKTDAKGKVQYGRDERDYETLAICMENGFRRIESSKQFLFRTRDDGTLRAMMSDIYAIVNNEWFIQTLKEIIPGGRLSHWKGNADTIFSNVLIPDTMRAENDSDYGGMLSIGNSEIGERPISSMPSVFRAICQNGCLHNQTVGKSIKQVHRGKIDLTELRAAIKVNLEAQIPLLPRCIDDMLKTKTLMYDGDSVKPLFAQVANEFKLSKPNATGLLEAYNFELNETGIQRSLFSVIAAVTRHGQKLTPQEWVKFDTIGGELATYTMDDWNRICGRAKSLKAKEVDECFLITA